MKLAEFTSLLTTAQQKKLSGGITCDNLKITENGNRQLTVSGDVTITLKVFDLTTHGASNIHRLMNSTRAIISEKLNGPSGVAGNVYMHKYDAHKKNFTKDVAIYNLAYNLTYIIKLDKITMLSQLSGNDFVLAVVDSILYQSDGSSTGGLTIRGGGPSTISYKAWNKYPYLGAHEFFHALKLADISDKSASKNLMYQYGGENRTQVTNEQRLYMNRYIIKDLYEMYKSPYSNPNLNTVANLRVFLNDSRNGFKYNKSKFR